MDKILDASISRRTLLKLGAISGVFLTLPLWNSKATAQSMSNAAPKVVEPKLDGLISFNAGWAIPLEDKPALLALEEKKIKEAKAALPPGEPSNNPGSDVAVKPAKKTWVEKAQEGWNKIKNFF